jgi:hypothetical protein
VITRVYRGFAGQRLVCHFSMLQCRDDVLHVFANQGWRFLLAHPKHESNDTAYPPAWRRGQQIPKGTTNAQVPGLITCRNVHHNPTVNQTR